MLDTEGGGAIFDGDEGGEPNASGGFDSNEACVGQEAGNRRMPGFVNRETVPFVLADGQRACGAQYDAVAHVVEMPLGDRRAVVSGGGHGRLVDQIF